MAKPVPQLPTAMWEEIKPVFAKAFPCEAIVAIHGDSWKQLKNVHHAPAFGFQMAPQDAVALYNNPPSLLLHSHPNGSPEPSDCDTINQIACGYPWGIVPIIASMEGQIYEVGYPECWGEGIPVEPLLGRQYLWGIRDCWTLCTDWYRLNGWNIPAIPRAKDPSIYPPSHWLHDQFANAPARMGFKPVPRHKRQHGDAVMMQYRDSRYNHCAVYLGESRYLHQLRDACSTEWIPQHEERMIERFNATFWRPPAKG